MTDDHQTKDNAGTSISGGSAALYFARDPSIAQLLVSHGISVRDFILVSFLSDQGPLSIEQLARIVSIEPRDLQESVRRLAAASLIVRDPVARHTDCSPMIRLTSRGQNIASRVEKQL